MMEKLLITLLLSIFSILTRVQGDSVLNQLNLSEKHQHLLSKLSHYELIRPYRLTQDGDFLSNDLSTANEEERAFYHEAKRSSLRSKNAHSRDARNTDDDATDKPVFHNFQVDAFGAHMMLNVTRNRYLVSPKMRVERYKGDGSKFVFRPNTLCFYTGNVKGATSSSVAISNCDGLSGSIRAETEEYIIEPLVSAVGNQSTFNVTQGHLHIMYKTKDFKVASAQVGTFFNIDQSRDTISLYEIGSRFTKSTANLPHQRRKAFDSEKPFVVETLIAVDHSVASYHGVDELHTYLLSMLNIMNNAYKHETMPVDIQFIATKIIVLSEEQSNNVIVEGSYRESLSNVFHWVSSISSGDHDYASFLTRINFGPAGFAPLSSMCMSYWSSSITSDQGLISSFIMAHEAAHVLGIEHDGDDNKCEPYLTSIMSPLILSTYHDYYWSNCSVKYLKKHLRIYPCIEDSPFSKSVQEVAEYPGELYSLERQCQLSYGENSRQCGMPHDFNTCMFKCSDHHNPWICKDYQTPALDGSSCGYSNQWCMKGDCKDKPPKRNGKWGKWSSWGPCSYECGTGVKTRQRKCDNPRPAYGGKECKGKSFLFKLCNKQPCAEWVDRRAEQCQNHLSAVLINGKPHIWMPHEGKNESMQCRLTCISDKTLDVLGTPYMVTDGTPCSYEEPTNICVRGQCVKFGCDKRLRSKTKADKCGVCKGDNSECTYIQQEFTKSPKKRYQRIDTIPAGAYNIVVREETKSKHFIALKTGKTYILNSGGTYWGRPEFVWGGARFVYSKENELLQSTGPIRSDLMLMIFWTNDTRPANITYSYYLHNSDVLTAVDAAGQRETPLIKPLTIMINKLQISSTDARRSPRIKRKASTRTVKKSAAEHPGDPTTLRRLNNKLILP